MKSNIQKKFYFYIGVFLITFFIASANNLLAQAQTDIDSDADGLPDTAEIEIYNTDPNDPDTDHDGYNDYLEIYNGYSPRLAETKKLSTIDSDQDGVVDSWEIRLGLNLLDPDTDHDGYGDGVEISNGNNPKSSNPEKLNKVIKINLTTQELAYYFNDIELEKFLISSGISSMPTPTGKFAILDKVPFKSYGGIGFNFYYPNTKWNLHFTTGYWRYYIHGAYWHNKFGQPMSHGCINVSYNQMERLYNFAQVGTKVEIK